MTTSLKIVENIERRFALGRPGLMAARSMLATIAANGDVTTHAAPASQFDGRAMTPAQWVAYCRELRKADALLPVQTVVVHHSVTSEYTSLTIEQVMRNWWTYYTVTKGWSGAPHGAVFSRGIGLLNVMTKDGIHCAGNNANSRGFEIMGNFTSVLPAGALLDNAVLVFAGALYAGKMGIGDLHMHREYGGTACPGNMLAANWTWFRGLVETKWQWFYDTEPKPEPDPQPDTIEARLAACETKLVAHGRLILELEQAIRDANETYEQVATDLASQGETLADHETRIAALEAMNGDGK